MSSYQDAFCNLQVIEWSTARQQRSKHLGDRSWQSQHFPSSRFEVRSHLTRHLRRQRFLEANGSPMFSSCIQILPKAIHDSRIWKSATVKNLVKSCIMSNHVAPARKVSLPLGWNQRVTSWQCSADTPSSGPEITGWLKKLSQRRNQKPTKLSPLYTEGPYLVGYWCICPTHPLLPGSHQVVASQQKNKKRHHHDQRKSQGPPEREFGQDLNYQCLEFVSEETVGHSHKNPKGSICVSTR